jgi:2-heptyl-3-hydroxy-4(1H)-quinolone synthase
MSQKILIVGAGIGGLAAACALGRDHEVTLIERASAPPVTGAGIVLAANATSILAALGVDLGDGHLIGVGELRRAGGAVLTRTDVRAVGGSPWLTFHRAELQEALLNAVPDQVERRFGVAVVVVREVDDGVEVSTSDGRSERFDLVIGADGLHSRVREQLEGDVPLRYSGVTCWRAVSQNPGTDVMFEAWGHQVRVGVVPLSRGRIYTFLVATAPRRHPAPAFPVGFQDLFAEFGDPVPAVLAGIDPSGLLHHDLEELPGPMWGRPRVWLLGDAAHGMTPNQGQGAAMAIEDAAGAALALAAAPPPQAFLAWRTMRHDRVHKVQMDSRAVGEIAHTGSRLLAAARDAAAWCMPASVSRRQLEKLVQPGLELARALRSVHEL